MEKRTCVMIGGGGHAAALVESLQAAGLYILRGVLDTSPASWGGELLGIPVLGPDELLPRLVEEGVCEFVVGLGSTGNNAARRRIFEKAVALGLAPRSVVHPSVILSPSARFGAGCQLFPGAIIHTRAILGEHVLVNTGAIVEHDCNIGSHAHISTGSRLAGGVEVGEEAHVGVGASVRQGIRIGRGAVVGAGAVVVRDVPEGVTVAGVPARPLPGRENPPSDSSGPCR